MSLFTTPQPIADPIDPIRDKAILFNKEIYGTAATYENVIIVLGYGAFFTIWANTAPHLNKTIVLLSGGLIGTSVLFYVAFQIAQMTWRMLIAGRYTPVFQSGKVGDEFLQAYALVDLRSAREAQVFMSIWPYVFGASLITGIAAALMIIGSAFWSVVSSAMH